MAQCLVEDHAVTFARCTEPKNRKLTNESNFNKTSFSDLTWYIIYDNVNNLSVVLSIIEDEVTVCIIQEFQMSIGTSHQDSPGLRFRQHRRGGRLEGFQSLHDVVVMIPEEQRTTHTGHHHMVRVLQDLRISGKNIMKYQQKKKKKTKPKANPQVIHNSTPRPVAICKGSKPKVSMSKASVSNSFSPSRRSSLGFQQPNLILLLKGVLLTSFFFLQR